MAEQYELSLRVKELLIEYGLKQNFIADKCNIQRTSFSMFMHGKLALSNKQLNRIEYFVDDYVRRNGCA